MSTKSYDLLQNTSAALAPATTSIFPHPYQLRKVVGRPMIQGWACGDGGKQSWMRRPLFRYLTHKGFRDLVAP
jgi:hypothetical protein